MKYVKYLGVVALLGALLVAVVALLSAIVNPKDCTEAAGMQESQAYAIAAEPENTIDVVVVGDSISATSIAPLKMYDQEGFTSFQCSYKAQRLCLTSPMIRLALENQTPEVVVIEADNLYYDMSLVRAVGSVGMKIFPVIQYHDRWKHLTLADFTSLPNYKTPNADKGFTARATWSACEYPLDYMTRSNDPAPLTTLNRLFLDDVVDYALGKGCQVVIVATPEPKSWTLGRHAEVEAYCAQRGIDFVDMNLPEIQAELAIDWAEDSQDSGEHMNIRGAMKVSSWLGTWLKDRYDLTDRRGDAAYASWNDAAADFLVRMDNMVYTPYDWSAVEEEVQRI